ncbi:MAG: tetraacyldisaccharide 4'-kinase [Bryobacterales bacterium]|nr:tetraacyldisaccharide 4'-kinase [Bryobacterales bacterium]
MFIYLFYRLLGALAFPLILLYLLRRGLRDRRYWKGIRERLGAKPSNWDATVPGGIWLHAVSVGEVVSAIELLHRLRRQFPHQRLYVSVTTVAGRQIAEEKLQGLADFIFYAPLDLCWIVRRVLRRLRPRMVIVMETEIWPNLYSETKRFGCGLLVVNGRISDRAYPKYLQYRAIFHYTLQWPDAILVQNKIAQERYEALGAPPERLQVIGNLKYDFRTDHLHPPEVIAGLLRRIQPRQIVIAASTMPPAVDSDPDEEDVVLEAIRQTSRPGLLWMLAPRRPERFDLTGAKLEKAGIPFLRRSQLTDNSIIQLPAVLLLDSMGELASLFSLADVVFMGGTLAQRGGHNILEPAFFSKPVIIGPHMENFPDIGEEFRAADAVHEIRGPGDLAPAVIRLLDTPQMREEIGNRAATLASAKRGATARAVAAIETCYTDSIPIPVEPLPRRLLLYPLSLLWRAGAAIDRRRKLARRGRLQAPVISAGGITMGGTGKTPVVAYLAETLRRQGHSPAILTRGYRRRSPEAHTILAAAEPCPVPRTGDEAQIHVRRGHAALGIGVNRLETGKLLEQRFHPSVFLLDDGYQHYRLHRDIDLVIIDGLRPISNGRVFPLGRLREPLKELRRASAFIVAHADFPAPWRALERKLHQYNPAAPIFYARMEGVAWIHHSTGESKPPEAFRNTPVAAFCGLGNPASFWSTLEGLGIHPTFQWAFGDHSFYRIPQLRRLAHHAQTTSAQALLTTEKDVVNLPDDYAMALGSLPVYWLHTRLAIHNEPAFLTWLAARLPKREVL